MSQLAETLRWLLPLIEAHTTRYHITGGFAARLYGANRPVNDLDIDLLREVIDVLSVELSEYVVFGPSWYRDTTWNVYIATLNYNGQEIDLTASEGGQIANKHTGQWDAISVRLDEVEQIEYAGLVLRVQNRQDLAAYKGKIAYEEAKHLEDIAAILATSSRG